MGWLAGFVVGALGGYALGSLVAPATGSELRGVVGGSWKRGRGGGPTRDLQRWATRAPRAQRHSEGLFLDERLTLAAREELAARNLTNPRIDITTVDGVMYLRGRPRDRAEAAAVVEAAQGIDGVERVVDELKPLAET